MLIWITGISGAGKSTIGKLVCQKLRQTYSNLIYLDGDEFRSALGDDAGFTLEDRDKNAVRITGICKLLCAQGMHIVCAANLTSQKFRDWCRSEIPGYFEVYLDVPIETLIARDPKGLYAAAKRGEKKNVVGIDIPFIKPKSPDLIIDNSATRTEWDSVVDQILTASGILTR